MSRAMKKCTFDFLRLFLEWQPCHFLVVNVCIVYVNLPTVLLMFIDKLASCPVPDIDLHLSFYWYAIFNLAK